MIVTYQSLVDDGLLPVPDVPHPTAVRAIRKAAIEFCSRSRVWVVNHDPLDLVAELAVYEFEPDSGTVVARVENVWVSGIPLTPTTRLDLASGNINWPLGTGTPTHYYQENPDEIILWPTPDSALAGALTMKVTLVPTQKSTGIEGWILERYQDGILHGATEELLEMPNQPWTDLSSMQYHKQEFEEAVLSAQLSVQKGFGKAPLRTKPQFF